MTRSVLPAVALPHAVAEVILSRAEATPLLLEELALSIQDRGGLAGDLAVPDTLQGVLLSRIGHLPETEQGLLQSAAVIGKDVPLPVLAAVAELPEEPLAQALRHLSAAEFLYEVSSFPEVKYPLPARAHPRGRHEEPPAGAPPAASCPHRPRHRGRPADRLLEDVGRLAHHATRGELWEKAVAYARQAGAKSAARSAHLQAVASPDQALDAPRICPRIARRSSRPSMCGSTSATRCTRWETPSASSRGCGRPKPSPGRSTIPDGSPGSSRS